MAAWFCFLSFFTPSGAGGYRFYSMARACAARTCGYFLLVQKVTKNTPEPTVLDSLLGDACGMTSAGDFRTRLQAQSCGAP